MAKRKRSQPHAGHRGAPQTDGKDTNLLVNSFEDVADSADEYFLKRDKILLDGSAGARGQHRQDVMEASDEEVLGYSENSDSDKGLESEDDVAASDDDDAKSNLSSDVEGDLSAWGTNKADYYNADEIETEQDALDEETEARRIQLRQRKALTDADFGLDEQEWFQDGNAQDAGTAGAVVTEVLPPLAVTGDMTAEDKTELLRIRYPEAEPLLLELNILQPIRAELAQIVAPELQTTLAGPTSIAMLKFRAVSTYLGSLAMYFAILTSPASRGKSITMPANELRKHNIFSSLEAHQQLWEAVEDMEEIDDEEDSFGEASPLDEGASTDASSVQQIEPDIKTHDETKAASAARRKARLAATEESLAQLSSQLSRPVQKKHPKEYSREDSGAGDEQRLLPHEAAEKQRKRKSLRFYTSQIAQRANKRSEGRHGAGGDEDIPYRERLRDRQERLNREAERRGRGEAQDEDLELGQDDAEPVKTNREREVAAGERAMEQRVLDKKQARKDRDDAYRKANEAGGLAVPVPTAAQSADGRRDIGWVIQKNKGLTPKRNKLAKNPRVKKRIRYEDKTKKLRSMKPTWKGGEARGGYGGELTGIKTGLVRSTKL